MPSSTQLRILKVISETPLSKSHDNTITLSKLPMLLLSRHFNNTSTNSKTPTREKDEKSLEIDSLGSFNTRKSNNLFNNNNDDDDKRRDFDGSQNIPNPIPNRPLRGERRSSQQPESEHFSRSSKPLSRGGSDEFSNNKFNSEDGDEERRVKKPLYQSGSLQFLRKGKSLSEDKLDEDFLGKFKLGGDRKQKSGESGPGVEKPKGEGIDDDEKGKETMVQDADEIFKKMKETGLIPNAVAMLDGLCKDGLVQEAMKLFGLMREKGTIPEVVIYTAVVEGFCKAQKLDDAKRIFRKMQSNGIAPNAFSYGVLIQGLYKCNNLEDAVEFAEEMLEAGHSPNVATLVGLVDGFSKEKGVEEGRNVVNRLRQKGFFLDEKTVREFLDKKGPSSPLVWEAIFGKKSPQKLF